MARPLTRTEFARLLYDLYEEHGVLELVVAHNTGAPPEKVAEMCAGMREQRAEEQRGLNPSA